MPTDGWLRCRHLEFRQALMVQHCLLPGPRRCGPQGRRLRLHGRSMGTMVVDTNFDCVRQPSQLLRNVSSGCPCAFRVINLGCSAAQMSVLELLFQQYASLRVPHQKAANGQGIQSLVVRIASQLFSAARAIMVLIMARMVLVVRRSAVFALTMLGAMPGAQSAALLPTRGVARAPETRHVSYHMVLQMTMMVNAVIRCLIFLCLGWLHQGILHGVGAHSLA